MRRIRPFQWVYAGLWLVRIWFALYGTGYIHPDEHMQNGEVTTGKLLGVHASTTWEWRPEFPVRSVLPIFLTTGLPLLVLRLFFGPERSPLVVHPSLVFCTQRLTFLCMSGILDYSILSLVSPPASRSFCLLLLSSSYVTCTFHVRPFSNSLESVSISLCLVLLRRIVDEHARIKAGRKNTDDPHSHPIHRLKRDLHLLAILAVIGTFTRPTFVAFAIPIAYQALRLSWNVAGTPARAIGLLLPPGCTAALAASVFIAADTYYFRGDFSQPVITPYNFVKYNLSTENLADHGLHPNWLHVGVNLPMLLGPLFVRFIWLSAYEFVKPTRDRTPKVHFKTDVIRETLIQIIALSLSILSAQPHQEPRFLAPLILPMIVLAGTADLPRPGKVFWATWIIFNMALALLFGYFHQGGVVPSLLSLHSILGNVNASSSARVVYWKTYMPPRHLLGVPEQDVMAGKMSLMDLSGAPQNELMAALTTPSFNAAYLVTPVAMWLTLPRGVSSCIALKKRIFPHLDLDHIGESIQAGVYDGLTLGIYVVDLGCIDDMGTFVT